MGEIDFCMQHFCDIIVFCELCTVVGGDGEDVPFKGAQELHDETCDGLGVFA